MGVVQLVCLIVAVTGAAAKLAWLLVVGMVGFVCATAWKEAQR